MAVNVPGRGGSKAVVAALLVVVALASCETLEPGPREPQTALIAKGREIFFNETFAGNGRTCGTCHRAEDNLKRSRGPCR